jgi:hypothetical protein
MGLLRNIEEAQAFYGGDFFVPYICIGYRYLSFASRYALKKKFSRMQIGHDPTCFRYGKTVNGIFFFPFVTLNGLLIK